MFSKDLIALAATVLEVAREGRLKIAIAESCTGGLVAACLTEIAGSSDVVERGFVTYSNEAKSEMLGVPMGLIQADGAVSPEVAEAMAEGALHHSRADVSVAITGVAGPGGGTAAKPVGLVHFACARTQATPTRERHVFAGNRNAVRLASVEAALNLLRLQLIEAQE